MQRLQLLRPHIPIGAVLGDTVGDSAFEAQLAGVVGQNAVENNSIQDIALAGAEGKTLAKKAEEFVEEQNRRYGNPP